MPPHSLTFQGPDRSTPAAFIESFCRDYKLWNDRMHSLSETNRPRNSTTTLEHMEIAKALYAEWTAPFLVKGGALQGISFGTTSTFDPNRLVVGHSEPAEDGLRMYFEITEPQKAAWSNTFSAVFETKGPLRLKQLYYIDPCAEDGRPKELPFL